MLRYDGSGSGNQTATVRLIGIAWTLQLGSYCDKRPEPGQVVGRWDRGNGSFMEHRDEAGSAELV